MSHKLFMQRALDLAAKGLGKVSPNPMVGCVIAHKEKIVGEGWHKQFGKEHAEVNAIDNIENKDLIKRSTVYVTLEPCSYHGKTPACTDLLIKYRPQEIIIASRDPNPKVSGRGIAMLEVAGFKVSYGIMEQEAIALNKRFFVAMNKNRPYIILKWAQTADGFIARSDFSSKWISNKCSREQVHKWRTEEDAILVGYNTVKYDNPKLTARNWPGRNPARVIIDPGKELDLSLNIFRGEEKVFVFNNGENKSIGNVKYIKIGKIKDMLDYLYSQDIGSVLIEGGSKTIDKFLKEGYWDEARIFTSQQKFGQGLSAPTLATKPSEFQKIMDDSLKIVYNPESSILWQKIS